MTTQKLWCIFLSAANKRSNIKRVSILLLLINQLALADESLPILSLPILQPEFIQKNQTGPQYQVGDRIQLTVRVPIELSQQLSSVQLKRADEREPIDKAGWFLDPTPQMINGNLRFIASPIKSGKLVLPELIILQDENHAIAKISPLNVDVAELKINPEATPALLDTISISLPLKFIILGLLLFSLLVYFIFYFYKKYRSSKEENKKYDEIKVPPTPDHIIALKELSLLYEKFSFNRENLKPVAFGISEILKLFFSSRFKIDAKESTTNEMITLLRKESLPEGDLKKIEELFTKLDIIKFTETHHHQFFQKSDYLEFKDHAKSLIESWAIKGENS